MEGLIRSLRLAWRSLWRRPLPTVAALLCLTVGLAAATVMYGVIQAVLLSPLPFDDPDELYFVWGHFRARGEDQVALSGKELEDLWEHRTGFAELAGFIPWYFNRTDGEEPERLSGGRISAAIFPLLGVEAVEGRVFTREEEEQRAPVALVSHRFWQERLGGAREALDKPLTLDDNTVTVIGVLPEDFRLPVVQRGSIWVPLQLNPTVPRTVRGVYTVGRIEPGTSPAQTQAALDSVAAAFAAEHPDAYPGDSGWGLHATTIHEQLLGEFRPALYALFAAVGLVLAIACANVANLLLAQVAPRQREVALRVSLGARRGDLLRQLLIESVLLSLTGGAAGLLVAYWGLRVIAAIDLGWWQIPRIERVGVDPGVLAFALGASLLTGIAFGLLPALKASRPDLQGILKEGVKTVGAGRGQGLKRLLVAAEVALAVVVLVIAGLTVRSLRYLERVDPGFRTDGVLTAQLFLAPARYRAPADRVAFYQRLDERLAALPGVRAAGLVSHLPFGVVDLRGEVEVEGRDLREGERPSAGFRMITSGYFEAMGITLTAGRHFDSRDHADALGVVIVDEALARRLWAGENPLEKRIRLVGTTDTDYRTVKGVVSSVRHQSLAAQADEQLYVPFAQYPHPVVGIALHAGGDPRALARPLREAVTAIDPLQPVGDLKTTGELLDGALARTRFHSVLFLLFAAAALVLAAVGVYGVLAQGVAERQGEIGVRMALGARPRDVLRQVLGEGMALTAAGLVAGLSAAVLLSASLAGWLAQLVVGVRVLDGPTFVGAPLVLLVLALLAIYLPARRATRVDPLTALRG
jgi:putative ABC transport system permease protein